MKPPRLLVALFLTSAATAGMPSPYLVKDIRAGEQSALSDLTRLRAVGNNLLFCASDGVSGSELWKSDGTAAGTTLVKDLCAGSHGGEPFRPMVAGNNFFFTAHNRSYYHGLWKSDGTTAGTVMMPVNPGGIYGPTTSPQGAAGNFLYFTAITTDVGEELWRTDGTAAGTLRVTDFSTLEKGPQIQAGTAVGSHYYFTACHPSASERALWRTDGTRAGTLLVKSAPGFEPARLTASGSTLLFEATDALRGTELWRSNGTSADTFVVKDIASGSASGLATGTLTAAGDLVYFAARTGGGAGPVGLWRSDGTADGTYELLPVFSTNSKLGVVGKKVFFTQRAADNSYELWKSDGTRVGTVAVKAKVAPLSYVMPTEGGFYFGSAGGLWQSDGTAAGTYQVSDTSGLSLFLTSIETPVLMNGKVYYMASQPGTGYELYAYDLAPPSISRPETSGRTKTAAKVDLALNPNGFVTTAKFEYGTSESYGTTIPLPMSLEGGRSFETFSIPLSGLSPGTTHHYRITATSAKGTRITTGSFDTLYTREDWRIAKFATPQNAGHAADDADSDSDGLSNLIEYAFSLDPSKPDSARLPQMQMLEYSGAITFDFTKSPGIEDIDYSVEWSDTLEAGSWTKVENSGTGNRLYFLVPKEYWGRQRFVRWVVTPK